MREGPAGMRRGPQGRAGAAVMGGAPRQGVGRGSPKGSREGQRRRRLRAIAAAVPPATAPTPAAAGMPTFAALRPVR